MHDVRHNFPGKKECLEFGEPDKADTLEKVQTEPIGDIDGELTVLAETGRSILSSVVCGIERDGNWAGEVSTGRHRRPREIWSPVSFFMENDMWETIGVKRKAQGNSSMASTRKQGFTHCEVPLPGILDSRSDLQLQTATTVSMCIRTARARRIDVLRRQVLGQGRGW